MGALTRHVIASAVALDVLAAFGTLLARLADGLDTRLLFLLVLFLHSMRILLARLTLVPWTITVDTSFCSALVADADIFGGVLLTSFLRLTLRWSRIWADLQKRLMHLTYSTFWCHAPPPAWDILRNTSPLQLIEPRVDILGGMYLDIRVLHDLGTLGA